MDKFAYHQKKGAVPIRLRLLGSLLFVVTVIALNLGTTLYVESTLYHRLTVWQNPFNWMAWSLNTPHLDHFYRPVWLASLGGWILVTGLFYLMLSHSRKPTGNRTSHGTARWSQRADIQQAGLLNGKGVYVGAVESRKGQLEYLRHNSNEHILCYAPTGSGKGVSFVLPTLLSWPESVVTLDIKPELYEETAGWRSTEGNNICLKFDPARRGSVKFNPLEEIRTNDFDHQGRCALSDFEVADTQNIAAIVTNPNGKDELDHFNKNAYALIVALILHALYLAKQKGQTTSLAAVGDILKDPDSLDIYRLLSVMMTTPHMQRHSEQPVFAFGKDDADLLAACVKDDTHPLVLKTAADMFKKPSKELGSIVSTASDKFNLFLDPVVAANTASSDFRLDDLRDNIQPVSLYIQVRPTDEERMRPLTRIIFTLITKRATEDKRQRRHRLLMLFDEFTSIGKLQALEQSLHFLRGYGIKVFIIVQDTVQLQQVYGPKETISSGCEVQLAFAPNKPETAKVLSDMTGTMTVVEHTTTISGKRMAQDNLSQGIVEKARPLLTPDEVMRLPPAIKDATGTQILEAGKMLAFVRGYYPILGTQSLYFKDPVFSARHGLEPPTTQSQIELI